MESNTEFKLSTSSMRDDSKSPEEIQTDASKMLPKEENTEKELIQKVHNDDLTITTLVDNKKISFSQAKFVSENQLTMMIDNKEHIYSRTGEYKGKIYFQCINRNRKKNTGKKCLAKAN